MNAKRLRLSTGIYHRAGGSTPISLSRIVEIQRAELTEKKWDFYLKASVDFVLADNTHEPLLAVEFDGWVTAIPLGSGMCKKRR